MEEIKPKGDLINPACQRILQAVGQQIELGRAQREREVRKFHRKCFLKRCGSVTEQEPIFQYTEESMLWHWLLRKEKALL